MLPRDFNHHRTYLSQTMDSLSITVSILTVLGTTGSIGKAIKKLVMLRGVPDALLALNNEVSDFHLIVSKTDALLQHYRDAPCTTSRNADFAAEVAPLLERGKARLLELECLIEYTLTSPGQNGESVLNGSACSREHEKVNRIKEELCSIRTSLATLLSISASSAALISEVQLSELRFISNNILEHQRQTQAWTGHILTRYNAIETSNERIQILLQELLHTQTARQSVTHNIGPRTASNEAPISASTEANGQWLFGLAATTPSPTFSRQNSTCQCYYKTKHTWKSPDRMKNLLGMLFLGYSASPSVNLACDKCRYRRKEATLVVRYVFPAWFIARALYFSPRLSTSRGLEQVLRVPLILPNNTKILDLLRDDDFEGVKAWTRTRENSLFGVNARGSSLLHVSLY